MRTKFATKPSATCCINPSFWGFFCSWVLWRWETHLHALGHMLNVMKSVASFPARRNSCHLCRSNSSCSHHKRMEHTSQSRAAGRSPLRRFGFALCFAHSMQLIWVIRPQVKRTVKAQRAIYSQSAFCLSYSLLLQCLTCLPSWTPMTTTSPCVVSSTAVTSPSGPEKETHVQSSRSGWRVYFACGVQSSYF